MEPVVPRARDVDGELAGDHLAEGEAAGGIEHRPFDPHVGHKLEPAIDADLPESAGDQLKQTRGVEVIQRRKNPAAKPAAFYVRLRHILQQRIPIFHHMSVAIDHRYPIPCHSPISFLKSSSLVSRPESAEKSCFLVPGKAQPENPG